MMDQAMFLGWLKKSQDKDLFLLRLANGQETIEGKIVHMELFEWNKGGGMCSRGIASIL